MNDDFSDKDKKDWQTFIKSNESAQDKDKENYNINSSIIKKSIDLHGYTLEGANKKIFEFIENCFLSGVKEINIITGKGLRSKNKDDPYQSNKLSMLKYSVPEYIQNNSEIMNKISFIDLDAANSIEKGNFKIILKKK